MPIKTLLFFPSLDRLRKIYTVDFAITWFSVKRVIAGRVVEECYLRTTINSWQLEKEITHSRMTSPGIS
jgi:hypothetical protein